MILTRHDPLAHQLLPCASLLELQLQHCTAERGKRRKLIKARNWRDIFKCILFSSLDVKALVSSRTKGLPSHPAPPPLCNCRSGSQVSVFCYGQERGSCAGSWQGDKNPQTQACFSILFRAPTSFQNINIKKQTKRNTRWQSSRKHRVTPRLLMTPESSNYHGQIKLIWWNYWSLL